jgi:alcohol dehydrogenase class IV
MLPHVVRWNGPTVTERYRELLLHGSANLDRADPAEALARRLEELRAMGGLPRGLKAVGVPEEDLERLAEEAATQWTGQFNPRPFGASGALSLYRRAYGT